MKKYLLTALFFTALFINKTAYAQPFLYSEHHMYNPGDSISAIFGNAPGNPADWVGIFKIGDAPSRGTTIDYLYVNNTHTPGVAFLEGRVAFSKALDTGAYWIGFFEDNGFIVLDADTFYVLENQPFVSLNKYDLVIGEPFTVTFKNGGGNASDWIGVYRSGDTLANKPAVLWKYVNGTQTPSGGISAGSVSFDSGFINTGTWWVGFFENDGFTLYDSVGFRVRPLTGVEDNPELADTWQLNQNYPNPFNPSTKITYYVAEPVLVSLKVFDLLGNQITELVNEYTNPGTYELEFKPAELNLASGLYLYTLRAGDFVTTKKMMLLK